MKNYSLKRPLTTREIVICERFRAVTCLQDISGNVASHILGKNPSWFSRRWTKMPEIESGNYKEFLWDRVAKFQAAKLERDKQRATAKLSRVTRKLPITLSQKPANAEHERCRIARRMAAKFND